MPALTGVFLIDMVLPQCVDHMNTPQLPLIIGAKNATTASESEPATELQALTERARQLSKAIGQAKRAGQSIDALVNERREVEEALQAQAAKTPARAKVPAAVNPPKPQQPVKLVVPPPLAPEQAHVHVRLFAVQDAARWDAFVNSHPQASVYHLSGWRAVCETAFSHPCPYLLAEAQGEVVGVLPLVHLNSRLFGNFMVSLPYFNYGGVLCHDEATRQALLHEASAMARNQGCSHLELRDTTTQPDWPARTDKVAMWLALPESNEALWQQIGSKVRAQVKKAQSAQVTFTTGGAELLDDFYQVFAHHMRDLGTPVYSKRFFEVILSQAPGCPVLVAGRDPQGKPVSVALLLRFGQRMEVPWASTLRRAHAANTNMALYWHMLQHACNQGCRSFDFGRSTRDAPTYRFKKQWGAEPVPLYWHYWLAGGGELPRLNPDNPKYRLAIGAWKHLPVWLTQIIGPPIVRNLP